MRILTLNDELRKQNFLEEARWVNQDEMVLVGSWKEKFKHCWLARRYVEKIQSGMWRIVIKIMAPSLSTNSFRLINKYIKHGFSSCFVKI